jgi:hypothetical protein
MKSLENDVTHVKVVGGGELVQGGIRARFPHPPPVHHAQQGETGAFFAGPPTHGAHKRETGARIQRGLDQLEHRIHEK